MIDKNGKIGGKLNIIDLLILLVVLAALIFVGRRLVTGDTFTQPTQDVVIKFTANETKIYVAERLKVGDPLYDDAEHNSLGHITDIQMGDGYYFDVDDSGETIMIQPADSRSVTLTCLAEGTLDGNGLVVNGTRYGVGHSFALFAGDCKLYVRISAIDPA